MDWLGEGALVGIFFVSLIRYSAHVVLAMSPGITIESGLISF